MLTAIIQARMNSTRLPGKVLKKLGKLTALEWIVKRLTLSRHVNKIIIATSVSDEDYAIEKECERLDVECFRGDELDVMNRLCDTEKKYELDFSDYILEITGDCPFVCFDQIDFLYKNYCLTQKKDYVSNCMTRTWPDGFDIQIYRAGLLPHINPVISGSHRSHGGWNIINNSNLLDIRVANFPALQEYRYPEWGLTLDTYDDYLMLNRLAVRIDEYFTAVKIIDAIKNLFPNILKINQDVERKVPGEG